MSPPARHVLLRRLAALELLLPGARVMSTLAPTQNFPLIDAAVRPAWPGGGRAPCVSFTVRIGFVFCLAIFYGRARRAAQRLILMRLG